jgi:hypothetical protein
MKKDFFVSIIISFFSVLIGNNISFSDSLQSSVVDSLKFSNESNIFSDQEHTAIDSVLNKSEKSRAMTEEDFTTEVDSLATFRLITKKKIEQLAEEELLCYPLDFAYKEGYHIKTINDIDQNIIVNGFSVFHPFRKQDFSVQTYTPHFQMNTYGEFIEFDNRDYDLKVPLTITYLGLGEENMDHGFFSFHKGDVFNIKNLNFETSYLGTSGNWFNVNEKMANLNTHLWYKQKIGSVHYYATGINQKSSENRYNYLFGKDRLNEREISHAIAYKSKFVDLGIKISHTTLDSLESDFQQYFLTTKLERKNHNLDLTYEAFIGDLDFSLVRFEQQNSFFNFHLENYGFYRSDDISQICSKLFYQRRNFRIGTTYINTDNPDYSKELLLNSSYNNSYLKLSLNIGKKRVKNNEWNIFSGDNQLDIPYNNAIIRLQNRFENNIDAPENFPKYQSVLTASCIFDMNYSNFITLGITNTYASNYEVDGFIGNANNWDLFLKIQITKYFEIYGNLHNFFEKENMFTQMNSVPGRHFTYGVKWIFIN